MQMEPKKISDIKADETPVGVFTFFLRMKKFFTLVELRSRYYSD